MIISLEWLNQRFKQVTGFSYTSSVVQTLHFRLFSWHFFWPTDITICIVFIKNKTSLHKHVTKQAFTYIIDSRFDDMNKLTKRKQKWMCVTCVLIFDRFAIELKFDGICNNFKLISQKREVEIIICSTSNIYSGICLKRENNFIALFFNFTKWRSIGTLLFQICIATKLLFYVIGPNF